MRCLVFVVVQAEMRSRWGSGSLRLKCLARGSSGALRSTGAASSDLTGVKDSARSVSASVLQAVER